MPNTTDDNIYNLDSIDKLIINSLQKGLPICERPYQEAAKSIGITEDELLNRINNLLEYKYLSRFGPMFNAEQFGGSFTLAAMIVPKNKFNDVVNYLNNIDSIAHNYEREHMLNMWFVIGTEKKDEIANVITEIENKTGLKVYDMPKIKTFFINLYLPV